MSGLKRLSHNLFCIVSLGLVLWLSFLPEPINSRYAGIILAVFCVALTVSFLADKRRVTGISRDKIGFLPIIYTLYLAVFISCPEEFNIYMRLILPGPILYYLFKNEFLFVKNKDHFFIVIVACAVPVALIGILESYFKINILYEIFASNILYKFFNSTGRAMSTQGIPHVFATYLGVCLVLSYHLISKSSNLLNRLIAIICSLSLMGGIIVSGTRGLFLALVISSCLYFVIKGKKVGFTVVILILTLIILFAKPAMRSQVLHRFTLSGLTSGEVFRDRADRYNVAIKMSAAHPIKGVGLGNHRFFYETYKNEERPVYGRTPDNMYLLILAESGIVGLALFLSFALLLLAKAAKYIKSNDIVLALTGGIVVILLAMLDYDALYWPAPFYMFWILSGMLVSVAQERTDE